jgi:peptide/nickel transport system substrate-binding protein
MADRVRDRPSYRLSRRQVLRLLSLGAAVVGVGAACQQTGQPAIPPSAPEATPTQAPAQQPTGAPVGAAFRIAIGVDPDTLEPASQTTTTVANIVDYMVEGVAALQPDGTIAPALAERWEQSPDGKTYTFTLRKGVKFHDGSELDAEAVKLSWERILNPKMKVPTRAPFDTSVVEAVSAVDPGTVQLTLKNPFGPMLAKLASTEMGIVSKEHARKFAEAQNEEPVGTGPYKFRERRSGESVLLERFDGYWGTKPHYPAVQFRIVPEHATRESLLLANQVEMIILPPTSDIPALQRNSNVKVLLAESNRTIFVSMDLTLPGGTPLADKRVRQALNYAVDKEGIIKSILFGAAEPMDAPMAKSLFGYSQIGRYEYNSGKARQLLQEAGWKPETSLKFLHPTGRYVQDLQAAQAVAGNLRDVGVSTELQTFDWPSYLATINVAPDRGSAHMHLLGWAPGILDAFQQMVQFSKNQWPPSGLATSHYTNPQVEDLLDRATKSASPDERKEMYAEASRIIWDDAPWIFLWVQNFPIVHSAKVKNIGSLPIEKFSAVYAEPA